MALLGCISLSIIGCIGILCDIDTRALAFESFGAYVCNCYVWHVDLMVMLSRSGKPDKVQYTFNSVYCVGFTRICVFLTLSLSLLVISLSSFCGSRTKVASIHTIVLFLWQCISIFLHLAHTQHQMNWAKSCFWLNKAKSYRFIISSNKHDCRMRILKY